MKEALRIDQLTVDYEKISALWEISLDIPSAQLVAIVGPNGAGKSTLVKTILGLIKPVCGTISLQKGKQVSYVPQRQSVDWDFPITVYDLVMMGRYCKLRFYERPSRIDRKIVEECLDRVGLSGVKHQQISQLSGGQQGRAFIARALVSEADLYFLDEPFAGIDEASSQVINEILVELKGEGKTLFVVHHDLEEVKQRFDYAILLNRRLVASGVIDQVMTKENLKRAFGKENLLFDRLTKLTEQKAMGFTA
ncbi:MAG: Manganese transport system ATP-binding protein MntB [Chlamydiales bacterium]|nr:Manganese transport system ATP-binding protein MntB [Chlamydiales bacterium]MCH9620029.1 Manganese transport system ATP-binding protein MntB [Chlamydiales bacterium]MCH9622868.1 Manganese transport system ATP-binding protein MntB [Chlamydiales bacterium]